MRLLTTSARRAAFRAIPRRALLPLACALLATLALAPASQAFVIQTLGSDYGQDPGSDRAIGVDGASWSEFAGLGAFTLNRSAPNQNWARDGYWWKNYNSGLCMTAKSTREFDPVYQARCNSQTTIRQRWVPIGGSNYAKWKLDATNLCLTISSTSTWMLSVIDCNRNPGTWTNRWYYS